MSSEDLPARNLETFRQFSRDPQTLLDVYERTESGSRDALALRCSTQTLIFLVDEEDDTLTVFCEDAVVCRDALPLEGVWTSVTEETPWRSLKGSVFGWGWVTVNQQGYCDGVLLSFDGIEPTLMLNVIASSVSVATVKEV